MNDWTMRWTVEPTYVPWGILSSTTPRSWLVVVIQSYQVFSTPSMAPACGLHTTESL